MCVSLKWKSNNEEKEYFWPDHLRIDSYSFYPSDLEFYGQIR